jgi:HSP20 family molecular chaperone IbpA
VRVCVCVQLEGDEEDIVHYTERSKATLTRLVRLPITADPEQVTAKLDHGLLTVLIQKKEGFEEHPSTRVIDILET